MFIQDVLRTLSFTNPFTRSLDVGQIFCDRCLCLIFFQAMLSKFRIRALDVVPVNLDQEPSVSR